MSEIKNVIFDLGGVLLNINYNKTAEAFKSLGFPDFDQMYTQYKGDDFFDSLEMGHLAEEFFLEHMMRASHKQVSRENIINAWNAMLADFRLNSLQFLVQLKNTHSLFLLSNTNIIHQRSFDKFFKEQTGFESLNSFFKKAYYSHEIGLRKPNKDIFEFVLKDAGITAGETLFIDDSFPNTEAAQKLGIKTHLLLSGEKIEDLNYN